MTIKHLVISGGGPLGLRYLGALEKLERLEFWKRDQIESIYATSVGSIIGAFICLKYDWDTLYKYIIERPWKDAFKVTPKQLFDSYYNKGLFDKTVAEIIFKPLLKAKDLELTITLKELFEYSNIDFHIFTFELNSFRTVEITHNTYPNMLLMDALTMSSALPGIFMPTLIDDKCYIDGGVMCNYPLNQCLRDHPDENEILGIKSIYTDMNINANTNANTNTNTNTNSNNEEFSNVKVDKNTSLLEYVICFTINAMNFIRDTEKIENIRNTIKCNIQDNPLTLDYIQQSISSPELRKKWIDMGNDDALHFLDSLNINM